jgi:hypothetical protein
MATTKQSKKSESKSTIGAIYDKAKEVAGYVLAGAATGAVIGAAASAVKSAASNATSDEAKGNDGAAKRGANGKSPDVASTAKKVGSKPVAQTKSGSKPAAANNGSKKSTKTSAAK